MVCPRGRLCLSAWRMTILQIMMRVSGAEPSNVSQAMVIKRKPLRRHFSSSSECFFVFFVHYLPKENYFHQAGSSAVEGTSQSVLGSSSQRKVLASLLISFLFFWFFLFFYFLFLSFFIFTFIYFFLFFPMWDIQNSWREFILKFLNINFPKMVKITQMNRNSKQNTNTLWFLMNSYEILKILRIPMLNSPSNIALEICHLLQFVGKMAKQKKKKN